MTPVLSWIVYHRWWVIAAHLVIVIVAAAQIPGLRVNTDYLELVASEAHESRDGASEAPRGKPSRFSSSYFFVVESDDLFAPELLSLISSTMRLLERRDEFGPRLSPFVMTTVERQRVRALPVPMSPKRDELPWTIDEAEVFRRRLLADDIARNYFVTGDGRAILIYYQVDPDGASPEEYSRILNPLREDARVYESGTLPIQHRILFYLRRDAVRLSGLALAAMLVVSWLTFRSSRLMLLPLVVSGIGTLWSLGGMSVLGIPVTILTVIAPPLVLTLGSSYTIHVLANYQNRPVGNPPEDAGRAVTSTSSTIALAALTTAIGFMSLLSAETPALRDLAIVITVGTAACVVLSLTLLPALLAGIGGRGGTVQRDPGNAARTRWWDPIIGHWKVSLVAFGVVTALYFSIGDSAGIQANYMEYFPERDQLASDATEIARLFGGLDPFRITLTAPDDAPDVFRRAETLQAVLEVEDAILRSSPDVVHILSLPSLIGFMHRAETGIRAIPESRGALAMLLRQVDVLRGSPLGGQLAQIAAPDLRSLTLVIRYRDATQESYQTVASARRVLEVVERHTETLPAGVDYRIWGAGVETIRFDEVMTTDQRRATILSLTLVLLVSALAFRSLRLGLLSLVAILTGVMVNALVMSAAGIGLDLVTLGITSIIVGIGIDDAIHFLVRYREHERLFPQASVRARASATLAETGRPIAATSLFLVAGLCVLTAASFTPVRYFGLLMSIALTATMIATLVVLPALLIGYDLLARRLRRSRGTAAPRS